ncbi:glycerol-3-phosphate dehydrogenase [Burkholderiales bacterium JOSHI_001]|nr:glycerol-3-phosphate dehydrogenase [Burkholderiales bacterium JOSHI_001]
MSDVRPAPAPLLSAAFARGSDPDAVDVLVVGGGINGAGIARDLAGRGLSVLLVEKDDLAQHTSSSSTKLIHGGLRYLEYYEFSLVRKALAEREVLLRAAPHIMWPLRFAMPHDPAMRPVWMIRAGLFLYDHLAKRELLPGSRTVTLQGHPLGVPLKAEFKQAFVYSDGWVDDARLVLLNALDAQARGAQVLTRTACSRARRGPDGWTATLTSALGTTREVQARALVNAAGPWASQFLKEHAGQPDTKGLRLVKGSHIVVKKMFEHDHAYIFQNPDKRIIFAIPYEGDFTLIGTTDVEHHGAIGAAKIDAEEIAYLCQQASRYFKQAVTPADVVWNYSGVRPLLDDESGDASAVTRDYLLELDDRSGAPLLNIWGGKITTFRKLAEEAAAILAPVLGARLQPWTEGVPLPGGNLADRVACSGNPQQDIAAYDAALARERPDLNPAMRQRWVRLYGSRVGLLLQAASLGSEVAPGLYEAELDYLHQHEWALSADDVLWRRTKLGLHFTPAQRATVDQWWRARYPAPPTPAPTSAGATTETSCN